VYVHRDLGEMKEIKKKMLRNQEYVVLLPNGFLSCETWIIVTDRDTFCLF